MMVNPDTNKFEELCEKVVDQSEETAERLSRFIEDSIKSGHIVDKGENFNPFPKTRLVRPDGTPVPEHWSTFKVGENVVIKNYTFKVAYIGETSILFEPVGPVMIGDKSASEVKP
jgi:hypothetical protein